MLSWRKWVVPGVVTTAGLTILSILISSGPIQRDLTERSVAEIRGKLGSWADVTFDGRDATIGGTAPTLETQAGVVPTVEDVWGVRVVRSEAGILPLQVPYDVTLNKTAGGVTLAGFAPNEETKAKIVELVASAMPNVKIVEELELAHGAPAGLDAMAGFAAAQLGKLDQGSAKIGETLDLSGAAPTADAYERVTAALKGALPAGLKLGSIDVRPPAPAPQVQAPSAAAAPPATQGEAISPYTFSLARSDGGVTLSGHVPDEQAHVRVLDQVRALFGKIEIKDELQVGAGAPGQFASLAYGLMQAASRLVDGVGTLTDGKGEITGTALTKPALDDVKSKLSRVFGGATIDFTGLGTPADLPQVPPAECQKLMLDGLSRNSIRFDTGKAVIQEESFGLLDALSAAALRCPDQHIEVAGYTDSDGPDTINRPLSKARAEAVAAYLVASGVARGRLGAQGFGADRPVAANDTPENKALNRRIEFTVVTK